MQLQTLNCPECGGLVRGTVETVLGCAELEQQEVGSFAYAGSTDIWWDEQCAIQNENGETQVICEDGHTWFTKVTDDQKG